MPCSEMNYNVMEMGNGMEYIWDVAYAGEMSAKSEI